MGIIIADVMTISKAKLRSNKLRIKGATTKPAKAPKML